MSKIVTFDRYDSSPYEIRLLGTAVVCICKMVNREGNILPMWWYTNALL